MSLAWAKEVTGLGLLADFKVYQQLTITPLTTLSVLLDDRFGKRRDDNFRRTKLSNMGALSPISACALVQITYGLVL